MHQRSFFVSALLHVTLIGCAVAGWSAVSARSERVARVAFLIQSVASPSGDVALPEEVVAIEPVREELPPPPDPTEPPMKPFEPPPARARRDPLPPAAEPSEPLVRIRPAPIEDVAGSTVPVLPAAAEASSFVEAEAIDVDNEPPDYPALAIRRGWTGVVTLRLAIDESGRVTSVVVAATSGHAILDGAAVDAAAGWHFRPAARGGRPVASEKDLPVEFRLLDS